MFDEEIVTVSASGANYHGYEGPLHTTVDEAEETEERRMLNVEDVQLESYSYLPNRREKNEVGYEVGSRSPTHLRKYRMVRRKPAQKFYCRPCNKEIKYPSKIAEHLRKHTGERPYQCQICGAAFSQGHVLKVHMQSHHGELPYKCSYCANSFPSLVSKKQHEKTHYQLNVKVKSQTQTILVHSNAETEIAELAPENGVTTETHIYVCPVFECGMQSHSKEEVEEHIAVVHGEMQEWVEDGAVYDGDSEDSVVNETEECVDQMVDHEQHRILIEDDHHYHYYPYEESGDVVDDASTSGVSSPARTNLENGLTQPSETTDQSVPKQHIRLYEHFNYVDDPTVPPPTEEIEVETTEQQYVLDVEGTQIPLQRTIVYDTIVDGLRIDQPYPRSEVGGLLDEVVPQENALVERVRVLMDPKPPKKGRLTQNEYYDRMVNKNMQELEVDAATIDMAAPLRHISMVAEDGQVMIAHPVCKIRRNRLIRSQSDRPHGARNLDWIIDAVARGLDVDSASPHNRRKPVVHKCQYCGRVDKYPSKIKAHLRTHTGEKPFKCDICGMTFAQRTPMRLHVRRHLDQKPYVCTIEGCDLRFVSGALLNYHQQTKHFLTKRYICLKGCGRFFASARNQRNHEARCYYNTEQAHEFGDAIYEQLVYNDQEQEDASDSEVNDELEHALEVVESTMFSCEEKSAEVKST